MASRPSSKLETFENPNEGSPYLIEIKAPEFTCLCPLTGQPDFATVYIRYIPAKLCVELKSLKLYFWSFRDKGAFHEKVTGDIHKKLWKLLKPEFLEIHLDFFSRGGIKTVITLRKPLNKKIPYSDRLNQEISFTP